MPALLNNLQSSNLLVKEAAVNTLATLIESSTEHAALVCTDQVLGILVALLQVQVSEVFQSLVINNFSNPHRRRPFVGNHNSMRFPTLIPAWALHFTDLAAD